jgi:pimeloyl-ACP methyl ester carboxylesterase
MPAAAPRHQVQPKATTDHPHFTTHCLVLPDGAFLAYYTRPAATPLAPALVLVPETHGDRTQFYIPEFLDRLGPGMRLVVIESRGQGRSWPPPSPSQASIEQYASDVLAVVRHLGLSGWYIAGHSLGGMIALEIAGRRSAGLRGVVALEGWVHHRVAREAFPELPRAEAERAEARRQREERYRTQRWSAEEVAALGRIWTSWTAGEAIMRDLEHPLLSVWGDRGLSPRPDRARLLLPDKPNIELRWIAGADHYVTNPPHPAEVALAISRFIVATESAQPKPAPR